MPATLNGVPFVPASEFTLEQILAALSVPGGDASAANQLTQIGIENYAAGITTVTPATASTDVVGTTYTVLPTFACRSIILYNNTGVTLEFQRNGAGVAIPIYTGFMQTIVGITNASQIGVRRQDTSNTITPFLFEQYA